MLPPYDSLATLADLTALVAACAPAELWCLGDSFHDAAGCARLPVEAQQMLRALTGALDWVWVTGNHDAGGVIDLCGRTDCRRSVRRRVSCCGTKRTPVTSDPKCQVIFIPSCA